MRTLFQADLGPTGILALRVQEHGRNYRISIGPRDDLETFLGAFDAMLERHSVAALTPEEHAEIMRVCSTGLRRPKAAEEAAAETAAMQRNAEKRTRLVEMKAARVAAEEQRIADLVAAKVAEALAAQSK